MSEKFCVYETYKIPWPDHNYIGKTSVNNINNGYMGGGLLINLAIKKHGKENFNTNIVEEFNNEDDAYNAEVNYITLKKPYYNIHPGGMIKGAITTPYNTELIIAEEIKRIKNSSASIPFNFLYNKNFTSETKLLYIILKNMGSNQCKLPRIVLAELLGLSLFQIRRALKHLLDAGMISLIKRGNGLTDVIKIKKENDIIETDTNIDEAFSLADDNYRLQELLYQIGMKVNQAFTWDTKKI
tara:strand:+ start:178 stop:900 length:723 start_codon:yes stop_codon:yes gene_type:complete